MERIEESVLYGAFMKYHDQVEKFRGFFIRFL